MLHSKQNKGTQTLEVWNPTQVFHTSKQTSSIPNGTVPPLEWQADLDKFVELGTKIIITASTTWWAVCELIDFIKNMSTVKDLEDNDSTKYTYVPESFFTDLNDTTTTVESNLGDKENDELF